MPPPGHAVPRVAGSARAIACLTVVAATASCALLQGPRFRTDREVRAFTSVVTLHGKALDLHLAVPAVLVSNTLVVYATGDGGWFGTAVDMFHAIGGQGYRTVGFSARAFLRIERPRHAALNPRQLAADYEAILARAREVLELPPATPVVLTGWSRGAAFAALAGTEPALSRPPAGIVAIGLASDENLRVDEDDGDDGPSDGALRHPGALAPYERLKLSAGMRCAVIQAESDDYLAAAGARALLGPDTAARRLYVVPATNHRFSGGDTAFVAALADALAWVDAP